MTDPEIAEIFAFARSLWPHDVAPGSEGVQTAWSATLRRLDGSIVAGVLMAMAEHSDKFPSLAQLVDATGLEAERREKLRIEAERADAFKLEYEPTTTEKHLVAFDKSAAEDRARRQRELVKFSAKWELDVPARLAEIDEIGYCEERARALLERGVPPGQAGKELYYSLSEAIARATRPRYAA
ncbi:MAG TPA: hypothetical protein VMU89_14850 [Thermomicrobiaceae bacterium]|nr:hypothetical protein [Thermomicrobiaceae bacterium]